MATVGERLDQWLRDAHAMEAQAEQMLKVEADRIENYPELKERIQQHISETRSQRERLERCLEARGTSPSGAKDFAGQFIAVLQGVGGMPAGDEVVKGVLASYSFEHMEIASYRILIAAAEAAGEPDIAGVCEEICREEEAMASWLASHVHGTVQAYLSREATGSEAAKR
ncbi:ferritin-like domain-containing protein [Chelativorans salis]|uniref:Ferritin-like domain-containing protein n=1 Tax=Chelativorans salis TaxID=2978478 RepID=A0ABT2LUZ9_9HYPH|nr:ferritin-like domain-containing protein [Chelativorans sp. EGI FJ00035]MCT7377682.1 ferritin-like domain-containing protein [Chelativorans sp. EGI FJ00035]